MLLTDPAARPTVAQIHGRLMNFRPDGPTATTVHEPPSPPCPPSILKGKGLRSAVASAARPATDTGRRLVGKLLDRLDGRTRP